MTRTMRWTMMVIGALAIGAVPAFAANQLLVTSTAALPGSVPQPGVTCSGDGQPGPCGLEVVIDDFANTNDTYVVTSHPNAEATYNFSFDIYPNTLDMDTSSAFKYFVIGNIKKTLGGAVPRSFFFVYILQTRDNWYGVQANARQDTGAFAPWPLLISLCGPDGSSLPCSSIEKVNIRYEWAAATAPGANDGFLKMYRNDVLVRTISGLNNDEQTIDEAWFGAIWMANNTQGAAANGSFYFDNFVSTR